MHSLDLIYIDGAFLRPHGTERMPLIDPSTEELLGHVTLADELDAQRAVAAARRALPRIASSNKAERIDWLRRLHAAVLARGDALRDATLLEYGAPISRAEWVSRHAAQSFLDAATTLEAYSFERRVGDSDVVMEPVGVSLLITPWNSNAGSICSKVAMAIAAGCPVVVKPSEMSALQTSIVMEAFHNANLPAGAINVVNGRGDVIGSVLTTHPDVNRISFTGSGAAGKAIAGLAAATLKRVTLGLGGKSPSLVLPDADFAHAIPAAVQAAFMNNGQACIAGSRLLVPRARLDEARGLLTAAVDAVRVGSPFDQATALGPLASRAQFDRVQGYIQRGLDEGATLLAGGPGRPAGLERGYYVQPTVFENVSPTMTIARDEIFGPVLALFAYDDEDEAIDLANDSDLGLHAFVFSSDLAHAHSVARRVQAGRVAINGLRHDPLAPFGGFKQSGLGREFGVFGLESFLEAKAIMGQA